MFVVGATCGEALIPIAVGMIIDRIGLQMFPISILSCSILLVTLYLSSHLIAIRHGPKNIQQSLMPPYFQSNEDDDIELTRSASLLSEKTESTEFSEDSDIERF